MQTAHELSVAYTGEEIAAEPPRSGRSSIFPWKIDRETLLDSDKQAWSYSRFASTVMEVLTVLHHRNKLVRKSPVPKARLTKMRARLACQPRQGQQGIKSTECRFGARRAGAGCLYY